MPRSGKTSLVDGSPSLSDDALALEFASANADYVRFSPASSKWIVWDGIRWVADRCTVRESLRRTCRQAAVDADNKLDAMRLASAAKVAAVESLARSDPRLVFNDERWDLNPWLLNTQSGVVDLKSGSVSPHDPDLSMRHLADASAEGEALRWIDFLRDVTLGDADLQSYLQRVAGYCLTGSTREHVIFFLVGSGANGKSVFSNVLRRVMGDYATVANSELLTASHVARHPTELAVLQGVRLALVPEMERGSKFAESRMKSLSGGDHIAARGMRQDFSNFLPVCKLLVTANQMPALGAVDEAARRRLHVIPFNHVVPDTQRDLNLTETLLTERNGILAWAVRGCIAWQAQGLAPPMAVRRASQHYLENQDRIGRFLDECCVVGAEHSVGSSDLFAWWAKWSSASAEAAGSQRSFVQELLGRGFVLRRNAKMRLIEGVCLKELNRDGCHEPHPA